MRWPNGDSEMAALIRSYDWAATPLGPIARWPQSLKTVVDLMLDSPSMMSLVWGPEAIHLYNDGFAHLLREQRVPALGRSAFETYARSRDVFEADVAAGMAGKSARLLGQRYPVLRNGRLEDAWFDVDYAPVRDEAGTVAGVLWTLRETTRHKLAEQALQVSEARHRLLVESWAQAVWETDAAGIVVADSPSWRAYTGQTLEEWLGYGWLDAIHPDDQAYAERQWREAVAAPGPLSTEYRLRAPDGGWRWTNVRAAPVLDPGGTVEKWVGMSVDIDARKRAEAALRESEEKYRALFESMDEAYAVVEVLKDQVGRWVDFRFLDTNRAFMKHTSMPHPVGKTATELLGTPNPRWTELYGEALDRGAPIRVEETESTLGRTFDLNIFTLDRAQNRAAILFTNITSRKKIEAALRESEEQFRTLADTAPALIWRTDAKGENLFINRHFLEFTGKSAEEIRGTGWHKLIHPDDAAASVADYLAAVKAERAWQTTNRIRRHDGTWRWFENHAQPLLDAKAVYAGHVGVSVDVTDRVEAERALRVLQERQAFLLELSDALRLIPDAYEVQTTTTRLVAAHLGVDRSMYAEVEGEHGAETGTIRAQFVRSSTDGQPPVARFPDRFTFDPFGAHTMAARYRGEPLVVTDVDRDPAFGASERAAWQKAGVRAAVVAPLAKGGRLVAEFGVHCIGARDWTDEEVALIQEVAERTWAAVERARAEAALRRSEERFRQFASASAAGLWIRDTESLAMEFVSPAMEAIYGVGATALLGGVERWAQMIVPDDRERALRHLQDAREGETVSYEFRILRPSDQAFRWIRNTDFPLRDSDRIPWVGGIALDITEAKLAVEHQAVLLAELQHRVRNIMGVIRSMANRTAAGARDVTDYRVLLEGRLLALARVQALLTREANAGGSLRSVLEAEIAAQALHRGQYALTGPDIRLSPKAVEVLTLAFHELATNALKYGALSVQEGCLTVSWSTFDKRGRLWLRLDWTERGAVPPMPPRHRGFGSELIEARVPYELGGQSTITIGPEGARCHLEFPLKEGESILETDAPRPTATYGGTLDMTGAPDLTGRTVLVVEDDYYMASDTAAALRCAGAEVLGPCPDAEAARDLLEDHRPTHAILDLNLGGGGPRFEVAQLLKSIGVPFVFLTGYDPHVIPDDLAGVVRLQKPSPFQAIVEAVSQL